MYRCPKCGVNLPELPLSLEKSPTDPSLCEACGLNLVEFFGSVDWRGTDAAAQFLLDDEDRRTLREASEQTVGFDPDDDERHTFKEPDNQTLVVDPDEERPATLAQAGNEDRGTLRVDPSAEQIDDDDEIPIELEDDEDYEDSDVRETQAVGSDFDPPFVEDDILGTMVAGDGIRSPSSEDASRDHSGTVRFSSIDSSADGRDSSDQTIIYGGESDERFTQQASSSGSESRLKRLWQGALGSSKDPMHSLMDPGLEASEQVFERVVTRKVADANVSNVSGADYQLVQKLGEGAMGVVYTAKQFGLDRIVAFKTAKPQFQKNDSSRRQFLYEAQITSELDHSNIVPIYELGASEDGKLFYSMKKVEGTEWMKMIRRNSIDQNLDILMKVLDGVAYAHSKNIIHRDLKPENTMLGKFGEVFITDWGTAINFKKAVTRLTTAALRGDRKINVENGSLFNAGDFGVIHDGDKVLLRFEVQKIDPSNPNQLCLKRSLEEDFEPSPKLRVSRQFNAIAGTPCYMAPEMAGGMLAKIGKASDIYVLGAILFDLVTGKPPHQASSKESCLKAAFENYIVRPDRDDPLLEIAYKAMATNPKERYASVEEMQEAIRGYRQHIESVTTSKRAADLLEKATEAKDYDLFNRSLYGFREAIELWPQNKMANDGLASARLGLASAAFQKGDYDLVLQTADSSVFAESELINRAKKEKDIRDNRERSFRLLRRVVAAIVLASLFALSLLSLAIYRSYLNEQIAKQKATDLATRNGELATKNGELVKTEEAAKLKAVASEQKAIESEKAAIASEKNAIAEKKKAEELADKNAQLAKEQEELAKNNLRLAEQEMEAKDKAIASEALAKQRAVQVQLGEYAASLSLSKSQLESFDIGSSREILKRIGSSDSDVLSGRQPKWTNWGWNRVGLLTNSDLAPVALGAAPSSASTSLDGSSAVAATSDGQIHLLKYQGGSLKLSKTHKTDGTISTTAISPDGSQIVYCVKTSETTSKLVAWNVTNDNFTSLPDSDNRFYQAMSFSKDGKTLVAGINGGVWVWNRDGATSPWSAGQQTQAIRGTCHSITEIGNKEFLIVDKFRDQLLPGILVASAGKPTFDTISLDGDLASKLTAIAVAGKQAILAFSDNSMKAANYDPTKRELSGLKELETKHRAQVNRLTVTANGKVISSSRNEPVAHVWSLGDPVRYDSAIAGAGGNIYQASMASDRDILLVDGQGMAVAYDVDRQKIRRTLKRTSKGVEETYSAPVAHVAAGKFNEAALAIDENGVVDLWQLDSGETVRSDSSRWSYFGHTPGAELVDSAIDDGKQFILTSARLAKLSPNQRAYLATPDHDWEFCIWDVKTGQMVRRWSEPNRTSGRDQRKESIEQRLSLLDSGRTLLRSSDFETRLVSLPDGKETFSKPDFGAYFAVPNPKDKDWVMLVKRTSSVKMFRTTDPQSWDNQNNRDYSYADVDDMPVLGQWSSDGKRFYLLTMSGGLTGWAWDGNRLSVIWSSRSLRDTERTKELSIFTGSRMRSHTDADISLSTNGTEDKIQFVVRDPSGSSSRIVNASIDWSKRALISVTEQSLSGTRWLDSSNDANGVVQTKVHDVLDIDSTQVRSRVKMTGSVFISTKNARVLELIPGSTKYAPFGRSKLIAATGHAASKTLFAAMEDGSVWKFSLASGKPVWSKTDIQMNSVDAIQLSPDGSRIAIVSNEKGSLWDVSSSKKLRDLGSVAAIAWSPLSNVLESNSHELAAYRPDGSLSVLVGDKEITLDRKLPALGDMKVVGLHYFLETWQDPSIAPEKYLMLHANSSNENNADGAVCFVPFQDLAEPMKPLRWDPIPNRVKLATSPTEGVFMTGSESGTVQAWFVAPSWDSTPRPLFELEGHRGAKITTLGFSSDGKTAISADSNRRLFAWMSVDPQITAAGK